jgi:branched-chain amino acid transport system permease protein
MRPEEFFQYLMNGVSLGSLYALVAIGYTMVYGILRLINFAHGDIFMWGTYIAFYMIMLFSMPWWISFPLAIIATALLGYSIDRIAYKPLRNAPRISALITAIGVSIFLESLGVVIFGGRPKAFSAFTLHYPIEFYKMVVIGGVRIQILTFIIVGVTAILLLFLVWLIYKTKVGMAMRALSKDIPTTTLMGINADRIIGLTFALGSALAASAGIMWAMKFPQIQPYMGIIPGLKAFIAAVFGGIGNIQGAMIGGFLLGMMEILLVGFFPQLAGLRDAFAFILLIVILLVKPTGIMGEKVGEKV